MSGFSNSIISVCVSIGFLYLSVLYCNCQTTTLTPVDPDVVEGSDITFVCTVSSAVNYVNWKTTEDTRTSYTTAMGVQNGVCVLAPSASILSDTTKYSYTCSNSVYQVTVKNAQRSQHNNVWSCVPFGQSSGPTSTVNVQVPVSSVSITPSSPTKDVLENTVEEFICQTSASRPDASVTWFKIESGVISQINQNITSSTTNDAFSVTTSTLRFVPSRQQHDIQIYCQAENTVNTSPKQSGKITLNVLYTTTLASTIRTPTTKKVLATHEHIPSTTESTDKPENEVVQLLHAMHQEVTMKLDSCIKATNRLAAAEEERNRVLNRLVDAIINRK